MNTAQVKLLSVFSVFAIIGFGPVSPGCLIGMYVVLKRPIWFRHLIAELYENQPLNFDINKAEQFAVRKKRFYFWCAYSLWILHPFPLHL